MMDCTKYARGYYMPPVESNKWTKKEYISSAPAWCSVDLRDGNQSLVTPMSLDEKLRFFRLLTEIGFKEIEVGFPAASDTEYAFVRALIEQDMIPEDVTIQVLTQAREHIIKKTFEALKGCKRAIVHMYNSTSVAQREQVFKKSREQIKALAVEGAALLRRLAESTGGNFRFEYSPESFTGTEPEYALEVCNAVIGVWEPTIEKPAIINLPVTVEMSLPHVYASQIEYMCEHMQRRDAIIVSLHPHNDRGTAVACSELGLLAGADRVEGTLFGNGERTGNVDIITLALNMYAHGVDPRLDFSDMPHICALYENVTRMRVYERQPYCGALVFAAFSGSHQDAISKGMSYREKEGGKSWTVPYLPIDPKDVGREYDADVIRINSQSGKGGVGYVLETQFGVCLPQKMREEVGYAVKSVSDAEHRELSPSDVYEVFTSRYVNQSEALRLSDVHYKRRGELLEAELTIESAKNERLLVKALGNGRLDAVSNALRGMGLTYSLVDYHEHAMTSGSTSKAMSYVCIESAKGEKYWGAGVHEDIIFASARALFSAVNRMGGKALAKLFEKTA